MRTVLTIVAIAGLCLLTPARGAAEPQHTTSKVGKKDTEAAVERRLLAYQAEVARATLFVQGESCTGFVAEAPHLVVTAAHCIPYPKRRVSVRLPRGRTLMARLDRIDRDTDLALLRLDEALPVVPLLLSERVPAAGDRLMFVGRSDRGNKAQLARVQKLDRCPSLPRVPNAVFTSLAARPGDSGAPLVNVNLRVVGLVHGGARCHIAAPVATLARQLAYERHTILADERLRSAPSARRWMFGVRWRPEAPDASWPFGSA